MAGTPVREALDSAVIALTAGLTADEKRRRLEAQAAAH